MSENGITPWCARQQGERALVHEQVLPTDAEHGEVAPTQDRGVEHFVTHVHERADLDDQAAVAHHLHRLRERAAEAGRVDDHVDPLAGAHVSHLGRDGRVCVDGVGSGKSRRELQPPRGVVDRDDPPGAHQRRLDGVRQPEGPDADDGDGRSRPEAGGARQLGGPLEAVRDREDLRQHRHVVRERIGHPEHRRARLEVEVLCPAAEQVRRSAARERVAVVLQRAPPDTDRRTSS
jgi:hypothetical protein